MDTPDDRKYRKGASRGEIILVLSIAAFVFLLFYIRALETPTNVIDYNNQSAISTESSYKVNLSEKDKKIIKAEPVLIVAIQYILDNYPNKLPSSVATEIVENPILYDVDINEILKQHSINIFHLISMISKKAEAIRNINS